MNDPLDKCFSEASIRGLTLRNRLIKAATFEGRSPGGAPSESLVRFHERIGRGGVGMTTVAYCAAEADGRLHEDMMYMHEGIRPAIELFIRRLQATGVKVSGQLGHAGGFTKNRALQRRRPLGPSSGLNRLGLGHGLPWVDAMTKAQIRERTRVIAEAAVFMRSAGFDAIEIHFGHGYGISQFISPKTNKRKDEYGGTLTNRMRFALEALTAVRMAVGDDYPLLGKISMTDGVRGGVDYADSVEIAAMLDAGGLDVIVCSGGTSSYNPMLLFRGDSLAPGLIAHERSTMVKIGMKLAARSFFKSYPYEEAYFLEPALRIRDRVRCGVCYIGGICTNESIRRVMAAGFDFIQLGRALIFDPDLPKHAQAQPNYENGCSHCNQCATLIEAPGGVHCVERPENFA